MVTKTDAKSQKLMRRVTMASLCVALFLLVIKSVAWVLTDSVSIQASLVDSLVDSLATAVNFVALRHAMRPADDEHRFGHGKIEAVAAIGQSVFIAGAAFWVAFEAMHRFIQPEPVKETMLGLSVIGVTIVLTLVLVVYQKYVISHSNSTVVKADHLHYKSDLFLNASVIASLVAGHFFGISFLDPLCGLLIAIYISWTSWSIAKESMDILIDRELPDSDKEIVDRIVKSHKEVDGYHDLKTRTSGSQRFIQLHLELNGEMTLTKAHDIAVEIAAEIRSKIPQTEVLIHQDPSDDSQ